jgi:NTE family protein
MPSCISGARRGAIVAGLFACGCTPAQLTDLVVRIARQKIRLLDPDLPGILRAVTELLRMRPMTLGGILRGDKLFALLDDLTDGRMMAQADLPLFIPCVDLSTG